MHWANASHHIRIFEWYFRALGAETIDFYIHVSECIPKYSQYVERGGTWSLNHYDLVTLRTCPLFNSYFFFTVVVLRDMCNIKILNIKHISHFTPCMICAQCIFLSRHIKIFHKIAVTLPLDKPHIVRYIKFQLKWVVRDKNDAKALPLHSCHTMTGNITRPENIVMISRIYRHVKWYTLGTKLTQYRSEALSCWRIDVD